MNVRPIDWVQNYRGFIGPLSDKDADNWANVIRTNVANLKAHEVNNAMAAICADWQGGNNRPNAMTVIQRIKQQRNYAMGDVYCDPVAKFYDYTHEPPKLIYKPMTDLMMDLEYASDPVEAWSIICAPLDVVQCNALRAHAKAKGIKYERTKPQLERAFQQLTERMTA